MHHLISIFLTLLIFLAGGNFAVGLQIAQTDALNRVTTYEYDLMGRRTARILPQGQREEMTYNSLGQLTAHKDFNGQTISRNYDSVTSELLSVISPSNHPSLILNHAPARYNFSYDILGRRISSTATNKLGTVLSNETFSYDLRSQLTGYAGPTGTIGYGYDFAGNLAGTKSNTTSGYDVSYDYDALNRITKVYRGQGGIDPSASELAAYNYDANGNLNGSGYVNGIQHSYTYNALNRLTNLNVARSVGVSPTSLLGYAYTLNKNGHRTQITELSGKIITNTYDATHRLTVESISRSVGVSPTSSSEALGTLSYSYDSVGNRQTRMLTNATPALAALLPAQNQTFTVNDRLTTDTYDANGNTVRSADLQSTSPLNDTYSFDNRLIRRSTPAGKVIDLTYNPDGHRISKFISQNGLTQSIRTYLTDSNNPTGYAQVIEERDPLAASGQELKKVHLYGHDLVSTESRNVSVPPTSPIYYSYDGLGSVRGITNASGELEETYDYDAYGTLIGLTKRNPTTGLLESSNLTTPANKPTSDFLFTGEPWDADLNMYFLRARYLNTYTGRFHSQDSYEGRSNEPLTLHKYLYASGNPAMFNDPTGMFTQPEGYKVERLVRDAYKGDYGYGDEIPMGGWTKMGPKLKYSAGGFYYLKPDILDHDRKIWMEVKPFSLSGLLSGAAQHDVYSGLGYFAGYKPDREWKPSGGSVTDAVGKKYYIFNIDGILFYTDVAENYREALVLGAIGITAGQSALKGVLSRGFAVSTVNPIATVNYAIAAASRAMSFTISGLRTITDMVISNRL